MSRIGCKHKKKKVLLYSAILSLTLGSNSYAIAKDVTVSDGATLKNVIQNATEFTSIQFAKDINISSLNTIKIGTNTIEIDGNKNRLVNEKDSRFIFSNDSSLTLKKFKLCRKECKYSC